MALMKQAFPAVVGGVVNGNGNNKKKRRKLFIYGGIGLGIVLLIGDCVFAATRAALRLILPSWLGGRGDLRRAWSDRER